MITDMENNLSNKKRVGILAVSPGVSLRTYRFELRNIEFKNVFNYEASTIL